MLEKARQEKQALKRDRRQGGKGPEGPADENPEEATGGVRLSQEQVLSRLAALHQRFDDEQMSFEDFEDEKAELTRMLLID
jgi:hypothetical protein